jgi:hypothetical protein
MGQMFIGGPNKSGHDGEGERERELARLPFVFFVFFVVPIAAFLSIADR